MSDNTSSYGYEKLTVVELRKVITDLTSTLLTLKEDKKDWVTAANEAIKETQARVEAAVEAYKQAQKAGTDAAHEKNVAQLLKTVN